MIDLSDKNSLYTIYKKKKPNGKYRKISVPCDELKELQYDIKDKLEVIYEPPDCVHGFIKGRSCASALTIHVGKKWVCELDIKDFFPNITKWHLKDFLTEKEFEIVTLDGGLVQGSPCSPILSNMIMKKNDLFFGNYLRNVNISYSRFADNLIISGDGDNWTDGIEIIIYYCMSYGFIIPKNKINLMFNNQKQQVLGICINSVISIDRKIRKILRAKIHQNNITESDQGYLVYINSINSEQARKLNNGRHK